MAEERIFIEYKIPQNESGSITQVIRKDYTRQNAIEKISNHLSVCDIETMDNDEIAEAALNALLEK